MMLRWMAVWVLLWVSAAAGAQELVRANINTLQVCDLDVAIKPAFTEDECQNVNALNTEFEGKHFWLRATVDIPEGYLEKHVPLGLYLAGKISSEAYINGGFVGRNGQPGVTAPEETPGKMDFIFYVNRSQLNTGLNTIDLRLSSFHGYIKLHSPIHMIAIGKYQRPGTYILRYYVPSFIPLGVLIIGALYFGAIAFRSGQDKTAILVPLAALFAAGQLVSEVSRGVFPYEYPFHDIRLILILLFALLCGSCLLLHVIFRFVDKGKIWVIGAAFALVLARVFFEAGFDGRSFYALLSPIVLSAVITAFYTYKRRPKAAVYFIVLTVFSILIYQTPDGFLDIYFYYIVAGLLLFLFGQQIKSIVEEKHLRITEQSRADKLQQALDQFQNSEENNNVSSIAVSRGDRVDYIDVNSIIYCKGARDYVELILQKEGGLLHSGTLSELEQSLSASFLRVHRSYLVNMSLIQSLKRESSGSGILILTTGDEVPVSRRIMPTVKKALA